MNRLGSLEPSTRPGASSQVGEAIKGRGGTVGAIWQPWGRLQLDEARLGGLWGWWPSPRARRIPRRSQRASASCWSPVSRLAWRSGLPGAGPPGGGSREGLLPRNLRIAGGFAALVLGAGGLRALHPRRLRALPSSFHPRAVGDLGAVRAVCARRAREPGVEEQVGAAHLEPGVRNPGRAVSGRRALPLARMSRDARLKQ